MRQTRGKLFTFVIGSMTALAVAMGGCGGPYKGKAQPLPKVKKSTEPEETVAEVAAPEIKWDMECTVPKPDDPNKAKKNPTKAAGSISTGNDNLARAASATDDQVKVSSIIAAIEQYKKALLDDHYNAEATFQLAVSYAMVRKKGCAIKMLKRLAELNTNAKLAGGQTRLDGWLDAVEDEAAFAGFKTEALAALGR